MMIKSILAATVLSLTLAANAQAATMMHDMKPMHHMMKHNKCHKGYVLKHGKCKADPHMKMMKHM